MTCNQILVGNIRQLCKERRISISELEKALNFSSGLTSRWVRMSPSLDKVQQVAQYFGVSLDELTGNHISGTDNHFLAVLKKKTEDKDSPLKWEISEGYACIEELMESEGIEKYEMYECHYEEGIFVLLNINSEDESGIRMYILPEQDGVPVREQGSEEEMEGLWYAVEETCQEKMSIEKANSLKKRFIQTFG